MPDQDTPYETADQWIQGVAVECRYLQLGPIQWDEYASLMRLGVPAPTMMKLVDQIRR